MAGAWLRFDWTVSADGYRWVQAVSKREPVGRPRPALVAVKARSAPDPHGSTLSPDPDAALFRAFADVQPDQQSILQFAASRGDLGVGNEILPADSTAHVAGTPMRGTFLTVWWNQIAAMRRLIAVWDMLQREDREGLAPHIQWHKDQGQGPSVHFDSHPRASKGERPALGFIRTRAVIASAAACPELLKRFEFGERILPAWTYLQVEIDLHLHHFAAETAAEMDWDPRCGRPGLRFAAPTLLSAVWLQFADAVDNNRIYGRCKECNKWFVVAPDAARTHRRFCSNGCRSKAYRERQDRARRMFAEKMTIPDIAEALESDVAAVRRWITGVKD